MVIDGDKTAEWSVGNGNCHHPQVTIRKPLFSRDRFGAKIVF
jgi:hypothetical protein